MLVWVYMSSMVMSWPGSSVVPHQARQRNFDIAFGADRIADHIIPATIEIFKPIKYRARLADDTVAFSLKWRAQLIDMGFLGIRRDHIGKEWDQTMLAA